MGGGAEIPTAATHAALTLLTTERCLCDPPIPVLDEAVTMPEAESTAPRENCLVVAPGVGYAVAQMAE